MFEKNYQGDPAKGTVGLCELESLIPSMETLEELKKRCGANGMAIVTGRPRSDCDEFLKLHKIEHLFDYCVCMEDSQTRLVSICKSAGTTER